MSESGSWEELRDQFFAALTDLEQNPDPQAWIRMWRIFADHPWVQTQVASIAARILRQSWLPSHYAEDLANDAMILLGKHLRTSPDLRVDRAQAIHHFRGWVVTILTHNCQQAARSLRKGHVRISSLPGQDVEMRNARQEAALIELREMLDELGEPERSVLQLASKGHSLKQVAEMLDISYWRVCRVYQRGLEQLR